MFGVFRSVSRSRSARRSSGEVLILNTDGSVLVDRRGGRRGWRMTLPLKPLIQIAIVVTAVKLLLLADLGAGEYNQRIANLRAGPWYEWLGSYVLVLDPITTEVVSNLTRWTR